MFDSPPRRFFLDPWASDYGSALEAEFEDEEEAGALPPDTQVETSDWSSPVTPVFRRRPLRIVFVDGVQRVEAYGRILAGDRLLEAALASVAVGASISEEGAAGLRLGEPARILAIAGGESAGALEVSAGRVLLRFEPETAARTGPMGIRLAIERRRRELERLYAEDLAERDSLVVIDGRLSFDPSGATPVVGFAKTLHRLYLKEPELRLLPALQAGQRTPVFRISYGDTTRFSWFMRLPYVRPIHHPFAGIVRLETPEIGVAAAANLADLTAWYLPEFASRPEHDPRAPQNLMPVSALERHLRHELGDPLFIRRAIEDHLYQEVPA